MPATKRDGISRLERARQARELRDKGLPIIKVAKILGISRTYTSSLLSDPDGSKDRERKERYRGTCVDCGAKTTYPSKSKASQRCLSCGIKLHREKRKWTPERIIESIRYWNEIYGEPPKAQQWLLDVRGDGTMNSRPFPSPSAVQREFGSWSEGLEAAGFPRRINYERTPEWKAKVTKWPREQVLQSLREWAEEHGRSPSSVDYRPGAVSSSQVIKRFGSWENALREAGLPLPKRRRSSNGTQPPVPSFAERESTPLLQVVDELHVPLDRPGKNLLDVVKELPERS